MLCDMEGGSATKSWRGAKVPVTQHCVPRRIRRPTPWQSEAVCPQKEGSNEDEKVPDNVTQPWIDWKNKHFEKIAKNSQVNFEKIAKISGKDFNKKEIRFIFALLKDCDALPS